MSSDNHFPFNIFRPLPSLVALWLLFISSHGGAAPLKITIASDSTAATFPSSDYGKRTGWGR